MKLIDICHMDIFKAQNMKLTMYNMDLLHVNKLMKINKLCRYCQVIVIFLEVQGH